ncbi:cytochrome bc complex cytochrome b subunit [Amycolatopsis bartoniae]|uniref:Cytochrome bc1 complex cytochrome b subunit n=1 Tax=Amycolatopsis bartoniae TaxID=941986 RepID=A0A8H9IQ67_9PSEU|nr:cytochrome bc complex cytochrome b subunit [Amycolatopsis bartoniae]TVT09950.1 cytochrome bc complex cytochrome b subunit [Amycolatopsis bartoniae]GHF32255.1 ubiquinol-cytochrome c reductase cytochrome b subunit [Amycolatopsis bartoniae]
MTGRLAEAAEAADERYRIAKLLRPRLNKVFPEHFSFLFGELALYSFVVLLLTGTYLALFFDPSMGKLTYHGTYPDLRDTEMSRAFASTLRITFDVRGGLLVRQIHHWAANVFVAAILVHLLRIFFTGAFRKPREANWVLGVFMLVLAIAEGFAGYSLPDDLLSGTGLRIMSGIVQSIPIVGTWVYWLIFGGEFPGEIIIPRLFTAHILLLPGLLLALVAVHLAGVWYQKHTQFPGTRGTERNVVGVRVVPAFALRSIGLSILVTGVLVAMGGLLQINPVFQYGPYEPSQASINSQPDWYLQMIEGAMRWWPEWRIDLWHTYTIPAVFWPAVVLPALLFGGMLVYPFVEERLSRDHSFHNIAQRPRDVPARTSLGVMALTFYLVLVVGGTDDVIAYVFGIPIERMVWIGRIAVLVLPPLAYLVSYRICRRLQRADLDVLAQGVTTGIIERRPEGYYVEIVQPLSPGDGDRSLHHPQYRGTPVPHLPGDLETEQEEPASRRR